MAPPHSMEKPRTMEKNSCLTDLLPQQEYVLYSVINSRAIFSILKREKMYFVTTISRQCTDIFKSHPTLLQASPKTRTYPSPKFSHNKNKQCDHKVEMIGQINPILEGLIFSFEISFYFTVNELLFNRTEFNIFTCNFNL